MSEIVAIEVTDQEQAYLAKLVADVPDWGVDHLWRTSAQIMRKVYDALPVTTGTEPS